ncbi:hypothetical protein ON010_g9058 [Phytophthora cinnamomi]|nr:hypothetical protein ON010_g9058 [Phytophthora cinnamomi]
MGTVAAAAPSLSPRQFNHRFLLLRFLLPLDVDDAPAEDAEVVSWLEAIGSVRAHEEEHHEANQHDDEDAVHGVDVRFVDLPTVRDLVAIGVVEGDASNDAANRPRCQYQSVHGANVERAKHIGQECWNGAESTAIARSQDEYFGHERRVVVVAHEDRDRAEDNRLRRQRVEVQALARKGVLDVKFTHDDIRQQREHQPPAAVEDAVDRHDVGGLVGRLVEYVCAHAREFGQHDEAVELVSEEHDVHTQEVRRLDGVDQREFAYQRACGRRRLHDILNILGRRCRDGFVLVCRQHADLLAAVAEFVGLVDCFAVDVQSADDEFVVRRAKHNGAHVHGESHDAANQDECGRKPHGVDAGEVDLGPHNRPSSVAAHGKACGQTHAKAAEDTVAYVDGGDGLVVYSDGNDDVAYEERRRAEYDTGARAVTLGPRTHDRCCCTEDAHRDVERVDGAAGLVVVVHVQVDRLVEDGP